MTTFNLTCEAVEATLDDYLDETLEAWVRKSIDEHLSECARCTALLDDLRNVEREAAALPALAPERDIWVEVAQSVGAPVVTAEPEPEPEPELEQEQEPESEPLVAPSEPPLLTSAPLPISEASEAETEPSIAPSEPLVLASTALPITEPSVITPEPATTPEPPVTTPEAPVTAAEQSVATTKPSVPVAESLPPPAEAPVAKAEPAIALHDRREKRWGPAWMGLAAAALIVVTNGTTFLLTSRRFGSARTPSVVTDTVTRRLSSRVKPSAERGIPAPLSGNQQIASDSLALIPPAGPVPSSLTLASTQVTRSPDQVVYDKEISMLQGMRRRRKNDLDPSTAAVIDRNLRIIDSNIAQIRAALEKDPASSMLGDQESRALDMKVELLRRVALLRSNT